MTTNRQPGGQARLAIVFLVVVLAQLALMTASVFTSEWAHASVMGGCLVISLYVVPVAVRRWG